MKIRHHFVVANGVRHHVAECGEGEPLVLLHGWPEFWAAWEPIFARLGNRYRLIAPDFRGFGESENPHPEPTDAVNARSLSDDVAAIMDALDLERAGSSAMTSARMSCSTSASDTPPAPLVFCSSTARPTASAGAGGIRPTSTRSGTRPSTSSLTRRKWSPPRVRTAGAISAIS